MFFGRLEYSLQADSQLITAIINNICLICPSHGPLVFGVQAREHLELKTKGIFITTRHRIALAPIS